MPEVYLKIPGHLYTATYAMLCDGCMNWIEKDEEYAKVTFNEYDSCEQDIVNCKKCFIKG